MTARHCGPVVVDPHADPAGEVRLAESLAGDLLGTLIWADRAGDARGEQVRPEFEIRLI
jgi:hypothetical protein